MKINFKEFKVYTNLAKSDSQLINIVTELADGIYKTAQGIAGHSLALKIYNSKGEEEYTEEELINQNQDKFRFERDALLKKVDIAIYKSEDLGQDTQLLRAYRQALRDATIDWILPESVM